MGGDAALEFYSSFIKQIKEGYKGGEDKVKDGQFGADMQVHIQNDGPVTLELEALPPNVQEKAKKSKIGTDNISNVDG